MDGYRLGMKYLDDEQFELLKRISRNLIEKDKAVLDSIIKTFGNPINKKTED